MTLPVPAQLDVATAVIASGQSLSAEVNLIGRVVCGFQIPSAWTAADLTFQASIDNGTTYVDLYFATGEATVDQAAADRYIGINGAEWLGITNLKIRSGTAGTPVNQAAERSIVISLRDYTL